MINPKFIAAFTTLFILLLVGGLMYFGGRIKKGEKGEEYILIQVKEEAEVDEGPKRTAIDDLNELAEKVAANMRSEIRLNLNMMAQLRAYQEMLNQVQGYANKVERNIDIIKEITQNEFQEDVSLQASLFTGKRPNTVASHLEEFRASRVGAILAKMKEKEAGAVLDVWAKQKDPRVSVFYRQVMAAYLNNKRRDEHPELFNKLNETEEPVTQTEESTEQEAQEA